MAQVLNRRVVGDVASVVENVVYVGRPSKWGNPYPLQSGAARGSTLARYKRYLWGNADLLRQLPELSGCDLVCWCAPQPCHGDVLLAAVEWATAHPAELAARIAELEA